MVNLAAVRSVVTSPHHHHHLLQEEEEKNAERIKSLLCTRMSSTLNFYGIFAITAVGKCFAVCLGLVWHRTS